MGLNFFPQWVILGGKNPVVLDSTSSMDDAWGLPAPELIFTCAKPAVVIAKARIRSVSCFMVTCVCRTIRRRPDLYVLPVEF
jgi:hypothetical protein